MGNSIKCLKDNRFAVVTVGDVRDKKGFYYRFVDDIKDIFKRNGILLYNEHNFITIHNLYPAYLYLLNHTSK